VALSLVPLMLSAHMEPPELPAYGRVLLDVLRGNSALSIRADEAEEAWRVLTPVLDGWSRGLVPLSEYEAGSTVRSSRRSRAGPRRDRERRQARVSPSP
jgi:glucose-6-phosphate 1-dehydrogenase